MPRPPHILVRLGRRFGLALAAVLWLGVIAAPALGQAQVVDVPAVAEPQEAAQVSEPLDPSNPVSILRHAERAIPGEGGGQMSTSLSILLLMTVLTLAPALLVMCTSFTRIIIVLAMLRQAMGTQSLPPGQVMTGLALFMTLLVMTPTLERIHAEALTPLQAGHVNELEAWELAKAPLRDFMFAQIEASDNWEDVYMILNYRGVDTSAPETLSRGDVDMITLVPAYVLSELKTSFLIGFRLYLPFLVVDMVIASVLISMGMMMLPPVLISLPFKLLLFVMVDGWQLIVGNLLNGFVVPGAG